MQDRELLELAAKAAGYELQDHTVLGDGLWLYGDGQSKSDDGREIFFWSPLADDGDALRLAVNLGMVVEITKTDIFAACFGSCSEPAGCNPLQATRRAIVRAAAEVGKAMT